MTDSFTFNTEVEAVHKIGVDRKHIANAAPLKFLKNRYYKNTKLEMLYHPSFLDEINITCKKGHIFKPNWLEKRTPITPYILRNGNIFQPNKSHVACSLCNSLTPIPLPNKKHKGNVKIFGDEALRKSGNKHIYTYTLVSEPRNIENFYKFRNDFYRIKKKLLPKKPPSSWTLHFLELFNDKKRNRSQDFKHLEKSDIINLSLELGKLLQKYSEHITVWNCTAVYVNEGYAKEKEDKEFKKRVYYPLIMRVLRETTATGYSPYINFERTQNDGWAKNLFEGGRLTLMWPFLSHCLPVPDPQFKHPRESIFFEISDFISFCIARYLYIVAEISGGKKFPIDMDPRWLGEIRYVGFTKNRDVIHETSHQYPLRTFFKETTWENIDQS